MINFTIAGEIVDISDGIKFYGHAWARQSIPSINDSKSNFGSSNSKGSFSTELTGLIAGEKYWVTAYLIDNFDEAFYGEIKEFTVPNSPYIISTGAFSRESGDTRGEIEGQILDTGSKSIQRLGHRWSLNKPIIDSEATTVTSSLNNDKFLSTLDIGLNELGKKIYIQAFVEDIDGTTYLGGLDSFVVGDVWVQIPTPVGFPAAIQSISFVRNGLGYIIPTDGSSLIWTFNPTTNQFSQLSVGREQTGFSRALVLELNDEIYGFGFSDGSGSCNEVTIFDDQSDNPFWRPINLSSSLSECFYDMVGFSLNGKAYFGTGQPFGFSICQEGLLSFDPSTSVLEYVATGPGRCRAASFSASGKGYIVTGIEEHDPVSNLKVWEFDPLTESFRILDGDYPGIPSDRGIAFSLFDKGYVSLGADLNGNGVSTLFQFDPQDESWTVKQNFPGTTRAAAYVLTIDGRAYIGGGADLNGGALFDFWVYIPHN